MHADPPSAPAPPLATPRVRWRVQLLGALQAEGDAGRLTRLPTRAAAALLARLALAPGRAHAREELIELLWPGVELAAGRNRLRQTLSTLKGLLEPPGAAGRAVLLADRMHLRVVPGALDCDVLRFEQALRDGRTEEALALYRGELMPGFYDEWIHAERQRLAALHEALQAPAPLRRAPVPPLPPAPPAPPPPPALPAPGLPSYLTPLFGAGPALARLRTLVEGHRLVTLLGPGGAGKTRLAVELAQAWADPAVPGPRRFDRVAFVPLVACTEAAHVAEAVTRALHLPPGAAMEARAALDAALRPLAGQRVLLVLDNFEQLVETAPDLVARCLADCATLHLLVTSRRALGLDGEQCVAVEPLPLPAPQAGLPALAASPAVALFADRARAARADFRLGARNAQAVATLVRTLEGLPLAIELAASRVRSFAPAEMAGLLAAPGGQLALLARRGPRTGHDPRHASMAAVLDWSWRLLDPPAQRLLSALTLFPGGIGLGGLAAVLGEPVAAVAPHLDEVVAHSLARVRPAEAGGGGGARFVLPEPVRDFAPVRLSDADAPAMRARLRHWLVGWARGLPAAALPGAVAPELATVLDALSAAVADGAPRDAVELALALRDYWDSDALPGRLQAQLAAALASLDDQGADADALRADMHELLAYLRLQGGFPQAARDHADAALALAGDPSRRARALVRRAWADIAGGRAGSRAPDPADGWLDEALRLARDCGDRIAEARALHQCAVRIEQRAGDLAVAEALLARAQALWLALGDRRRAAARQRNRAQCWARLGRTDDALASLRESERLALEDGDWIGRIDSLVSQGQLLLHRRRWDEALAAYRRCIDLAWQRWHRHGLAYAMWGPPLALARLRRPVPAMQLAGFAEAFWAQHVGPPGAGERDLLRRTCRLARAQLGAGRAETLRRHGAALTVPEAVALATDAGAR